MEQQFQRWTWEKSLEQQFLWRSRKKSVEQEFFWYPCISYQLLLIHAFFVQGDLANGHGTVTFPEDLESVLGTAGFQVIH